MPKCNVAERIRLSSNESIFHISCGFVWRHSGKQIFVMTNLFYAGTKEKSRHTGQNVQAFVRSQVISLKSEFYLLDFPFANSVCVGALSFHLCVLNVSFHLLSQSLWVIWLINHSIGQTMRKSLFHEREITCLQVKLFNFDAAELQKIRWQKSIFVLVRNSFRKKNEEKPQRNQAKVKPKTPKTIAREQTN